MDGTRGSLVLAGLLLSAIVATGGAATAASVRGATYSLDDKPLPGVAITLSREDAPPRQATTDARGRYQFDDVPSGRCNLVARKAGFADQRQVVSVSGDRVFGVSFRLTPWSAIPWCITGTVLRADNRSPVAGAGLTLLHERLPGTFEPSGSVLADETGFFGFARLLPGRYQIHASGPGCLPASLPTIWLRERATRHTAQVALSAPPPETLPGKVRGRIANAEGLAVGNKQMRVSLKGWSRATQVSWGEGIERDGGGYETGGALARRNIQGTVRADAEGAFAFSLPPGRYSFSLQVQGYRSFSRPIIVPAGGESDLGLLRLQPGPAAMPEPAQQAAPLGVVPGPVEQPAVPRPAALAPTQRTLRVLVLRPDGTPVANTGIYLFFSPVRASGQAQWQPWQGELAQAYVVTDAAGRFQRVGLPAGRALVALKTRGFAETSARVTIPTKGDVQLQVRLARPPLRATGRVTSGGKPVAGAYVFAYRVFGRPAGDFWQALGGGWWGGPSEGGPWPCSTSPGSVKPGVVVGLLRRGVSYTETDAAGRFVLGELDEGTYHFGVSAPGLSRAEKRGIVLPARAQGAGGPPRRGAGRRRAQLAVASAAPPALDFALQPLGAIEVALRRPDGAPAAGVAVECWRTPVAAPGRGSSTVQASYQAGADGRFRLVDVPPGRYRLQVRVPGYRRAGAQVAVVPGKAARATVALDAGLELRGKVLGPDGAPAEGTGVWFRVRGGPVEEAGAVAGADGAFVLQGLSQGEGNLQAWLPDAGVAEASVAVPRKEGEALELRLQPTLRVRGTVRDDAGKPLPNVYVSWYPAGPFWSPFGYEGDRGARADAAGEFALEDVPPRQVQIHLYHQGHRNAREELDLTGVRGETVMDLVMRRAGAVRGVVLRPDGKPLAGRRVDLGVRSEGHDWDDWGNHQRQLVTGPDGRYEFGELAPGTSRLRVRSPGFAASPWREIAVRPGETVAGVDLRLSAGMTLRGRVLKPDGTPAASARVRARDRRGPERAAVAGKEGVFTLEGLDPGTLFVQAQLAGFAARPSAVSLPQAPGQPALLRLQHAITVRGQVCDAAGKPLARASVGWVTPEWERTPFADGSSKRTNAAGRYFRADIAPGKLTLSAYRQGYRTAWATREASAPGSRLVVDFRLAPLQYGRLRGRVLRPDGTPAAGIRLYAYSEEGSGGGEATTDAQGAFLVPRIAAGRASFYLHGQGMPYRARHVEVRGKADVVVPDIRLVSTGTLEGSVHGRMPEGMRAYVDVRQEPAAGEDGAAGRAPAGRVYLAHAAEWRPRQWGPAGTDYAFLQTSAGVAWSLSPSAVRTTAPVGGDGSFRVAGAPAGLCRVMLLCLGETQAVETALRAGVPVTVAEGQTARVELSLEAKGAVAGRVRGLPARLAEAGRVYVCRRDTPEVTAAAAIRADGSFSLSGLEPGDHLATVWERGRAALRRPFVVRAGETTRLELALAPGVALRGRVAGSRPKELYVSAESEGSFGGAPVAKDGTFAVPNLLPGTYTLRLWTPAEERVVEKAGVRVGKAGSGGVSLAWE